MMTRIERASVAAGVCGVLAMLSASSQLSAQAPAAPTRANILRGEYGRYRSNNDLLFYHLDMRVDPGKKFRKDPAGHPLINTACEGEGASIGWPNKDQWRDEVESMRWRWTCTSSTS